MFLEIKKNYEIPMLLKHYLFANRKESKKTNTSIVKLLNVNTFV